MVPQPKRRRGISPRAWLVTVVLSVGFSLLVIAGFLLWAGRLPEGAQRFNPMESVSDLLFAMPEKIILFMAVDINHDGDNPFEGVRTDTMMLVRLSPDNRRIGIVSIPRDSRVYLRSGANKINAAFALGGPELAVQTVETTLGIPIDNYIAVNPRGIRAVVDALGGVPITIEKPMHYRDRSARLDINFEPGPTVLSGKDAEAYLRFRHDAMADIGRVRRQQYFVAALKRKLADPWVWAKLPELTRIGLEYVRTDLNTDELVRIARFVHRVDPSQIRSATLPGQAGGVSGSFWYISPEKAEAVLNRLILMREPAVAVAGETDAETGAPSIRVGVLSVDSEATERLAERLQPPFKVSCRQVVRRATTQLIERSDRATGSRSQQLLKQLPVLKGSPIAYSPIGGSYEADYCSGREDYTVILGPSATKLLMRQPASRPGTGTTR